jgi:hypothetical protein
MVPAKRIIDEWKIALSALTCMAVRMISMVAHISGFAESSMILYSMTNPPALTSLERGDKMFGHKKEVLVRVHLCRTQVPSSINNNSYMENMSGNIAFNDPANETRSSSSSY